MSNGKEKDYQAYIDQLHKQIAELELEKDRMLETISEQANQLDAYETAMINAFVKWGQANEIKSKENRQSV